MYWSPGHLILIYTFISCLMMLCAVVPSTLCSKWPTFTSFPHWKWISRTCSSVHDTYRDLLYVISRNTCKYQVFDKWDCRSGIRAATLFSTVNSLKRVSLANNVSCYITSEILINTVLKMCPVQFEGRVHCSLFIIILKYISGFSVPDVLLVIHKIFIVRC